MTFVPYRGKDGKDGLEFAAAMDLILNMRGNNPATVKDPCAFH